MVAQTHQPARVLDGAATPADRGATRFALRCHVCGGHRAPVRTPL